MRVELTEWVGRRRRRGKPRRPHGVRNRTAENPAAAAAIADTTGAHWPATARQACPHVVLEATTQPASIGVRLPAGVRQILTVENTDRMVTAELMRELHAIEDGHGSICRTSRSTAAVSRPKNLRVSGKTLKGYHNGDGGLPDAWSRYIPPLYTAATNAGQRKIRRLGVRSVRPRPRSRTVVAPKSCSHPL